MLTEELSRSGPAEPPAGASLAAPGDHLLLKRLLELIRKGKVVPVVGPELLVLEIEGRRTNLYSYLAERLAVELGVDDAPAQSISEVAGRFLDRRGRVEDIYPALMTVMPPVEELPIPEPLLQLARIRAFDLYVTTTFDPLLVRALNQERFGGQSSTSVFAYSLSEPQDLPGALKDIAGPVVYHLFGQMSAIPDYCAVTDEDMLEFVYLLQSEKRPRRLLDELTSRSLLVLGCDFPEWLSRSFIRLAKNERLPERRKIDVLAQGRAQAEGGLASFLHRFSLRTEVFSGGDATTLVAELARRWEAEEGAAAPRPAAVPQPALQAAVPSAEGKLFLSYAREDGPAAEALCNALEAQGVDVWLDRVELEPGDAWRRDITRQIESCLLFVPLISRQGLERRRGFFRAEWDQAEKLAVEMKPSVPFIVPVLIDEAARSSPDLPEAFRQAQWLNMPGGRVTPEVVDKLKKCYREAQT